eukprot:scaffold95576_cov34-Attheya_sp.AAC.2
MGLLSDESVEIAQDNPDIRAAYELGGHDVTDGLETFQLKPTSKKGEELLDIYMPLCVETPRVR